MACTLYLSPEDPAVVHLVRSCIDYLQGASLESAVDVPADALRHWIRQGEQRLKLAATDQGFDERANTHRPPA